MVKLTCFVFIVFCLSHETDVLANDDIDIPPAPPAPYNTPRIAKRLKIVGTKLSRFNAILGIYSRSMIVKAVSQSMRGEASAQVLESLNQASVTLAVLDVGGGVVMPVVQHIIKSIATVPAFSNTKQAMESFGVPIAQWADEVQEHIHVSDESIKARLNHAKGTVLTRFENDVAQLSDVRTLKHIRKAKIWLKVKSLGNVLGPIFDIACVGVNSWALHTTLRDCQETPSTCNYGAIASASLSIAAGFVGLATFAALLKVSALTAAFLGPAGAIIAALLGITATCIELFYTPPSVQIAIENALKENAMKNFDVYAKVQLFNANKILVDTNVERNDLYVVNQGHLPKWFTYDPPLNTIEFGTGASDGSRKYSPKNHRCSAPHWGAAPHPHTAPLIVCPYLVDGKEFISTNSDEVTMPQNAPINRKLGFDFYGFAKNFREYLRGEGPPNIESPYQGTMVLVATNKVQPNILSELELSANLRGLNIDTAAKSGNDEPFDDLITIGDMSSLDTGEEVVIRTGRGNDALNIDGRLGTFTSNSVLNADLGQEGHNTLNFGAMASNSGIEGIIFDARTDEVQFKHGSNQQQLVGIVRHVEILEASPFNDEITLHAKKVGEEGFDFTVFKFKGLATYKIDISMLASQVETRYFKIIDSSTSSDNHNCEGHVVVLKLFNFGSGAKANDILYKDDRILVYGERTDEINRSESHDAKDKDNSEKHNIVIENGGEEPCIGEMGGNPTMGPSNKELLANIALYVLCPVEIEAKTSSGSCVMRRRKKEEIDTCFFPGSRLHIDFRERHYVGSSENDYALLKCPSSVVSHSEATTIDLSEGPEDYLVIGDELFLEPCGIDGSNVTIDLVRHEALPNAWKLVLGGDDLEKLIGESRYIIIIGVEKILNEYGNTVIRLTNNPPDLDLYQLYAESTMENIGRFVERDHTREVKDNLLTCIAQTGDISQEEREELCES